jgi:YgiT-type zinc finger domain-containing protein
MQRRNELRVVKEAMIETEVTYTVELGGKFYIVEHVPARVCQETGEQFFAPETVKRIQALIKGGKKPTRVVETSVYEYT